MSSETPSTPSAVEEKATTSSSPVAAVISNIRKNRRRNKRRVIFQKDPPSTSNAIVDNQSKEAPTVAADSVSDHHGGGDVVEDTTVTLDPVKGRKAPPDDDREETTATDDIRSEMDNEHPNAEYGSNKDELAREGEPQLLPAHVYDKNTNDQANNDDVAVPSQVGATSSNNVNTTNNNSTSANHDPAPADAKDSVEPTVNMDVDDTDETDLRNPNRRIWVVTTAAMPWRTGTAVNPLMRALYLTRGRPKHYVTLVIPWLADVESQRKLFGADHVFDKSASQEAWIRDFCRTRANCTEEESNLRIIFYASKYHTVLGSIFPSEDICSLIPDDEADVAILEEPEHLNWFRMLSSSKNKNAKGVNSADDEEEEEGDDEANTTSEPSNKGVEVVLGREADLKEKNRLGWAVKFRYVVGILHTNYAAYMAQYGFGTSIIAAPALSLLSSIVVRAYCNRVIRLSAALPILAPHKEVTCNVHGVRSEFLDAPTPKTATATTESSLDGTDTTPQKPTHSPVYFIGKVIWAKGFDKVLEVQDLYRQKTGHYFAFDIYGGGPDEKAIRRAFFGRHGSASPPQSPSGCESPPYETKEMVSKVFGSTESLRGLLLQAKQAFSAAVSEFESSFGELDGVKQEEAGTVTTPPTTPVAETKPRTVPANHLSVLGDLPGKSVSTGLAASKAVYTLADKLVKAGMSMTFDNMERDADEGDDSNGKTTALVFSPPQSRFEWRRHPIPARFRGIVDHVEIRDVVENKIFLNMSTTEVLCTTTAEALAMGKFVILPNHSSNEFFLPFPNCLPYDSIEECAEKLKWALEHDPQPLTEEHIRAFSWEGATDRLFVAAHMTIDEKKKRDVTDKEDKGVARFHVESMIKGQLLTKFFAGEK